MVLEKDRENPLKFLKYGAGEGYRRYLESFEIWCWRRIEMIP
jgi:hypothetical protein